MKREFEPSSERLTELDALQPEWQAVFSETVKTVGDALGSDGNTLAAFSYVRLVEGEDHFKPWPEIKYLNGEVEVTCNLEGFHIWEQVLSEAPSFNASDIRRLYLATAATSVELCFLADSASQERAMLDPKIRSLSIKRASSIINKLYNREELLVNAEKFEQEHGVTEVTAAIMNTFTESQILELNKFRYGLGTALFALDVPAEVTEEITEAFKENFIREIIRHEETLIMFLSEFSRARPAADITTKYTKAKQLAFQEFLFAGTIPMGYENKPDSR